MLKRNFSLLISFLICPLFMFAQVTTSSISGTVKQGNGEFLAGATITAVHQPSGTKYVTISKKEGNFTLPGLRAGGPYILTSEYVGYKKETLEAITLMLGEDYNANIIMEPTSGTLSTVVITGTGRNAATVRSSASTNVGPRQLATLPTITRSITDFTRLTPQANGTNFGGRDARYNNVTVDGANLNNNFGLSTDPLPGGGANPISLDAVEEVSINIAPSDVRQSNFTGANIVAITKSGTNTFKGTLYSYYRDQSFAGRNVGDIKLTKPANNKSTIFGGSIGGPIIKNKLFFFVNAEFENKTLPPGSSFSPTGGSGTGNISSVSIDSLRKFSDVLRTKYGYETGGFDNFPNFQSKNHKILAKVDWNINTAHKFTMKYSELVSQNDVAVNALSVPNGATGGTNTWTSQARFGANAMSFQNSNYHFQDEVRSGAAELNSNWRGRFSNQLIGTYTRIRDTRVANGSLFPFIDIIGPTPYPGGKNNYMSAGTEPFSNNNDVKNNIWNITDNFNIYAGKHTITLGGSYEYQYVGNMFMPASQSYYTFSSLDSFIRGAHPIAYALTFSRVPGQEAVYSAAMKIAQYSAYVQDEFNIRPNFKLIYGLRIDKPSYPEQPLENPAITALTFKNRYGQPTSYSTGQFPNSSWYVSPRLSVRWDVENNKKLILRAATGLFTGRIPFVYLTNMPTNSGMYQVGALADKTQLSQITFDPDPKKWQSLFTVPAPVPNSAGFVLIDKNYKFPQVARTNIGFDKKLSETFTLSMDAIYTREYHPTIMRNANQSTPTSVVNLGGSSRPSFTNTSTATRRIYNAYANAIVLENANQAPGAFSWTTQLSKSFSHGLYASIAYTYTEAFDLTANPGSTAASTWSVNPTSGTQNDQEMSYSQFSVPHRIVETFSYRHEYIKHLATTLSFFYEGSSQGRYSYIYGAATGTVPTGFANTADVNYDGNSSDLMYIPNDPSEIKFVPLTVGTGATAVTYSAQQQSDAFFALVDQDKYLSKHKGQVAERNGAKLPFYHRVDAKLLQDLFANLGGRRNTLQFSVECTNLLNMLNKNWGLRDITVVNNPLRATKNATTGEVRYQLATYTPNGATTPVLVDRSFIKNANTTSTWSLQIGFRYIF